MSNRSLPLTESARSPIEIGEKQEAEIAALVSEFYGRVLRDPLLGPVFEAHVKDWDAHMPRMQVFWVSVAYRAGRYAGNPLQVHRALGRLRQEHFERWLVLWEQTVHEVVESEIGPTLILNARRMGQAMSARLESDRVGPR